MIKKEVIMYKVMTPGPTQVKENVRMARSLVCTNPDQFAGIFIKFYEIFIQIGVAAVIVLLIVGQLQKIVNKML